MFADETAVNATEDKLRYLLSNCTGVRYEDVTMNFSLKNDVKYNRDKFNNDMSDLIKQHFHVDITPNEIGKMKKVDDLVKRIVH